MGCIPHQRQSAISVIPHALPRHKVFQSNCFHFCVRWYVHDALVERACPPIDQLFHQPDPLLVRIRNIQGLLHAPESFSPWPADQNLAFERVRIGSRVVRRGIEEGEEHEDVCARVSALEEERI